MITKVTDIAGKISPADRQSGNAILMLFAVIGMAGVLTYGLNNVMRGPAMTTAEVSRRTIAENNIIASSRLAIAGAVSASPANKGDCDGDGFVEPIAFRDKGALPAPVGGGLLPMTLGSSLSDPWGVQYGYCVWDPGTATVSDNIAACGGNTAKRLEGAPRDDQYALAVISAGKNGAFETTCNAFVDTTPADGVPDTTMLDKPAGSDDIVLAYTYAEANGIGGGEWKLKESDDTTAETSKNLEVDGGGQFTGKLELTTKGMVLPGDPGDDTVTGACDEARDQQIRRNTSGSPPSLEICDYANGGGWETFSSDSGGTFNVMTPNCTSTNSGPLVVASTDSSVPIDMDGYSDGNYVFAATDGNGLRAYAKTSSGLAYLAGTTHSSTVKSVWSDGTQVYTANGTDGYKVYGFNGSVFAYLDADAAASDAKTIWGDGHYLYGQQDTNTDWYAKFDASAAFAPLTGSTNYDHAGTQSVWGDGTYIFLLKDNSGTPTVSVYRGNGLVFDDVRSFAVGTNPTAITGDGTYLYVSTNNGVEAYNLATIYGYVTSGVWVDPHITNYTTGGAAKSVWSDGANVYAVTGNTLRALDFDGTSFSLLNSITPGTTLGSVFGDGDYIYTVGESGSGSLIAYSGFECTSHETHGPTEGYVEPDAENDTVDVLDRDLAAQWDMADGTGSTVADSIEDYDGTFVNSPVWINGIRKYTSLSFSSDDRDAVQISGLLGSPHQGTLAMWVNVNSFDTSGASHFFSLGNSLFVGAGESGPFFGYNNGGGISSITGYTPIQGTGWRYLVVTFDDVSNNSDSIPDYNLYLDGMLLNSAEFSGDITYADGADTWIGRHGDAGATYDFDGGLGDIRLYNRALGPAEVKSLSERMKNLSAMNSFAPVAANTMIAKGSIEAGSGGACGIKAGGRIACWGDGTSGQIGNNASSSQPAATMVDAPSDRTYYLLGSSGVAMPGAFFNIGLRQNFSSVTFSDSFTAGQTKTAYAFTETTTPGIDDGLGRQLYSVQVTHSDNSCIELTTYVARTNSAGTVSTEVQLGQAVNAGGTTSHIFADYVDLGTFAVTDRFRLRIDIRNFCSVAIGSFGITTGPSTKVVVPVLGSPAWLSVSVGGTHTCGIKADGTGWCWGVISGTAFPSKVLGSTYSGLGAGWATLSSGDLHSCGVKVDGTLWCWGSQANGQIGDGTLSTTYYNPKQVGAGTDWQEISAGATSACGIKTNGTAWCWGDDGSGQLGNGAATAGNQTSPTQLDNTEKWARISVGGSHACGIKLDGSAWCWGSDSDGQLGNRPDITADQVSPVHVDGPDNWVDISAGATHTCGVRMDGSAWCWGNYLNGRLGLGTISDDVKTPQRVMGGGSWIAVDAGGTMTCGLQRSGSAWCWGSDANGQLGNGATETADQFSPSPVSDYQDTPGWGFNDAATIMMSPSVPVALNGSFLSDSAGYAQGFGFTSAGSATIKQQTAGSQLMIETQTTGLSAQTTLKTDTVVAADQTTGLVAKWLFDETSGTTAASAPITFPGTLYNTPTWWSVGGKVGGALSFVASSSQYVQVGNHASLRPTNLTLSFWIKRDGAQGSDATVLAKAHASNTAPTYMSYGIGFNDDSDSILTFTTGSAGGYHELAATTPIRDGVWTYVVATYEPGGAAPQKKLYINGVLDSSATVTNAIDYDSTATGDLFIGQGGCVAPCAAFNGAIDDLRLYSDPLSAASVLLLYQHLNPQTPRSIGYDSAATLFEIDRNATGTAALSTLTPDLAINASGSIGIGTSSPQAKLDVNGGVRIGYETACSGGVAGAIRFTGGTPPYQYCNGTSWVSFSNPSSFWKTGEKVIRGGQWGGCGIKSTGRAYCWGRADWGRMGNGGTPSSVPSEVHTNSGSPGWDDWVQIDTATNTLRTCGVRANGTAWCWGTAHNGNNSTLSTDRPVQVHSDSSSTGWTDWTKIGTSAASTCGLRTNGTLWCWGQAASGNLGNNQNTVDALRPVQVLNDAGGAGWTDWVDVIPGCGIRADGSAWCWGSDWAGHLGSGGAGDSLVPRRVQTDTGPGGWSDWVKLTGGTIRCGIRVNGTAWCWGGWGGCPGNNSCGSSNWRPAQVHSNSSSTGWTDWVDISAGDLGACGIRANGTAWCWGYGTNGQLGNNSTGNSLRPTQVLNDSGGAGWSDWVSIGAGIYNTCGVRADGSAWCWGWAGNIAGAGLLGTGQENMNVLVPSRVQ